MSAQPRKDGDRAFPSPVDPHNMDERGMSLRDYFAAKALSAVWREPSLADADSERHAFHAAARRAYRLADAMLAAREGGAR